MRGIDNHTNNSSPNGVDKRTQQIWGVRYIDDAVAKRVDTTANGSFAGTDDRLYFYCTDAQFSTVALLDKAAHLVERVSYSAYGVATHRWANDVNNSGNANSSGTGNDYDTINELANGNEFTGTPIWDTTTPYDPACDLNRDGIIDENDPNAWSDTDYYGGAHSTLSSGLISDPAGPDNEVGYDGYMFSPETKNYCVRFRWYEPTLGRWMERDPAGYVDGLNLLEYGISSPAMVTDPSGLIITSSGLSSKADRNRLNSAIKRVRSRIPELQGQISRLRQGLNSCEAKAIGGDLDALIAQLDVLNKALDPNDVSIVVNFTQDAFSGKDATKDAETGFSVTGQLGSLWSLTHPLRTTTRTRLNTNPLNDWRNWTDDVLDEIVLEISEQSRNRRV